MKSLLEIITNVKHGERPDYEDLFYAVHEMSELINMTEASNSDQHLKIKKSMEWPPKYAKRIIDTTK